MASYQIPAIEAFDFSTFTEWTNWTCHFEWFRNASGIAEKSEESQIHTLIYSMEDKEDDILQSFNLSEESLKSYKSVKERFDAPFVQKGTLFLREVSLTTESKKHANLLTILLHIYTAWQDNVTMEISMKTWSVTELQ